MRLLFLNIIILYIGCVLPFNITKRITLSLSIPSPFKMKNYQINYYQGVKIDICNYDKNDSYIWEGYRDTLKKSKIPILDIILKVKLFIYQGQI